jgi:DNA polymerase-1
MRLLLVDGHYYAYRSFYAIRHLTNSKGQPTNAVFGYAKALKRMLVDLKPDRMAVVFDEGPPQARLDLLPSYKAQREETPEALEIQFPKIMQLIEALGFPQVSLYGEEADDLMASYAREALEAGWDVVLATKDKDLMQLVSERCHVYQPGNDGHELLGPAEIRGKWGVEPNQIVDLLRLMGDTSDNIPGVPGVGPKTAAVLIQQFSTVENLLNHLDEVKSEKTRAALEASRERIVQNMALFQLRDRLELPQSLEKFELKPSLNKQVALFRELEFKSMLKEAEEMLERNSVKQGELF